MQQSNYPPNNGNNFGSYQPSGYDYNQNTYVTPQTNSGGFFSVKHRINGLEIIVIFVSIISLVGVFWWALSGQNAINRDKQRLQDINQIIGGLNEFYKNSNTIPSQRAYPKAVCSESLNEVDFEYTLKRHMTGQVAQLDNHVYIESTDYPKDRSGVYATTFKERKVTYRCSEKLNLAAGATADTQIYGDGTQSCNFNQANNYTKCYLYTSSNNGDTFRIGYWQESAGKFVTYRKFREEPIKAEG
jgi:hypothetical protein